MEIRQIRSFRAIVATGSFGTAAQQLGVTQSALSHQVKQLEDELGVALLVRARPHVYVTEAGQTLLSTADRIIAEINDLHAHFGLEADRDHAELVRIAATTIGLAHMYGDLCHAFIERSGKTKLDFQATETPEAAVSKVLTRAADVAFTPLPIESPALDVIVLGEVEHVFITSKSHELAVRKTIALSDVKRTPFIRYHRGSGSRMVADKLFAAADGYPPIFTETNDTGFVKRIVGIGLGIALVPVFVVTEELRNRSLHALRLRNQRITDQFGLVLRKRPTTAVKRFVDVCLECRGSKPRKLSLDTLDKISFYQP